VKYNQIDSCENVCYKELLVKNAKLSKQVYSSCSHKNCTPQQPEPPLLQVHFFGSRIFLESVRERNFVLKWRMEKRAIM
jgi:hypothetical protein